MTFYFGVERILILLSMPKHLHGHIMQLLICFFLAFAPLLTLSAEQSESKSASLPEALLFRGKPIPDPILEDFFGLAVIGVGETVETLDLLKCLEKQDCSHQLPEVSYEWEYLGSPCKDVYAVWAYYWEQGCMGKFSGILLLKRLGDTLQIVDTIYGGDRHSSMIFKESCHIHENMVVYSQGATTAAIVDIAREEHPELDELYNKSSKNGICYGEAGYFGYFDRVARIDPNGKIKEIVLTGFTPAEGGNRKDLAEIYRKEGFKGLALVLLDHHE